MADDTIIQSKHRPPPYEDDINALTKNPDVKLSTFSYETPTDLFTEI